MMIVYFDMRDNNKIKCYLKPTQFMNDLVRSMTVEHVAENILDDLHSGYYKFNEPDVIIWDVIA